MEIQNKELHRVVTTTIIYRKKKGVFQYLIIKRSPAKKVQPNKWAAPGGGLSTDDYVHTKPTTSDGLQWYGALEKSLYREVAEEVGIKIGKPEFLLDLTFVRPDGIPVICFSYFAKYISGTVQIDADAVDFAWVTLAEAKKYDLIEGVWGEIRDAEKILKKRG